MTPEAGPFEAFYASPIQHPLLLWLAAGAALVACTLQRGLDPTVRRYCLCLVGLSAVDAWLTSTHVYGVGTLGERAASFVPLFFVLAGDFRYLLLLGTATENGRIELGGRPLLIALLMTLIVPATSQATLWLLPESLQGPRVLFLVYELAFLLLTAALLHFHPRVARVRWLAVVSRFVLVYYGLWATADAIILATGSDLGFLLRVVPNVLYYGGLIAMIAWASAIRSER